MKLLFLLFFVVGCSSFESKFTSHVGCSEDEVKVLYRSHNLMGVQNHTVSCRGMVFHCTEEMKDFVPTNLRCARRRAPSSR